MANVIFTFNANDITIQCENTEKMSEICQKFVNKIEFDINKLIFLYGGNLINKELTLHNQASKIDKERNKMNVLVYEIEKYNSMDKTKIQDNYLEKEIKIKLTSS